MAKSAKRNQPSTYKALLLVRVSSTKQRQESGIEVCKAEIEKLLTDYVQLWNEKDTVMSQLRDKFDRDFDYME